MGNFYKIILSIAIGILLPLEFFGQTDQNNEKGKGEKSNLTGKDTFLPLKYLYFSLFTDMKKLFVSALLFSMFFIFSNETLGQEFYRVSVVKSSSDFSTIRCYIPREKVRANIVFEEDITSQNLKIASKIKNNNGAESIENNFLDKIIVLNGNWVNENCLEIMVVNNSQEHIKTLLYDIFDIEMLKVKID
jgi:hypothetical protein